MRRVTLQPGRERPVRAGHPWIFSGAIASGLDGAALQLTLNGAAAKPVGRSGQVVTLHLNPANFTEYLAKR